MAVVTYFRDSGFSCKVYKIQIPLLLRMKRGEGKSSIDALWSWLVALIHTAGPGGPAAPVSPSLPGRPWGQEDKRETAGNGIVEERWLKKDEKYFMLSQWWSDFQHAGCGAQEVRLEQWQIGMSRYVTLSQCVTLHTVILQYCWNIVAFYLNITVLNFTTLYHETGYCYIPTDKSW